MTIGVVLYCDAGTRPTNPGHTGWGLHGYKYLLEEPKKGTGLSDQILTNKGYMLKTAFAAAKNNSKANISPDVLANFTEADLINSEIQQVTPICYIDGHSSFAYATTNNVGEITAAIEALRWCRDHGEIHQINIYADSQYVVEGTNKHLQKWKNNGWLKQDRTPVANQDLWREFDSLLLYFSEKQIPVCLDWVRAHNGDHGNEMADHYATVGALRAWRNQHMSVLETSEAEGYWKHNVERHPFITHKGMIFNTLKDYQIPGQYYMCDNVRDVEMMGKKNPDGALAFIAINKPDAMLEMVREFQSELANGSDTLILTRLEYLFNPTNNRELTEFGTLGMFQKNPYRLDLMGLNNEPITRELRPAKLAIRAVEALSDLAQRLDQFLVDSSNFVCTDITPLFYEEETVKRKKEEITQYKLRPEISVGLAAIKADVKYNVSGVEKSIPISLTFGIDLPGRNSIKHMEELKPKIQIITWKESDMAFRYATVISTEHDKGIWAGVYSNLVVINDRSV